MNRKTVLAIGAPVLFFFFLLIAGLERGTHFFDFRFFQFQSPLFFVTVLFLGLGAFLMFALFIMFPPRFGAGLPLPVKKMLPTFTVGAPTALQRAETQLELGNVAEAVAQLKQISKGQPDYARARKLLGGIADDASNYEESEFHYQESIKALPGRDRAPVMMALALLYSRHEKYEMARDLYCEVLRLNPETPAAVFHLRALSVEEKNWDDALMWQVHLEEHFPDMLRTEEEAAMSIGVRYEFAALRYERSEYKNAQSLVKHIFRLTNEFTPAYLLAGEILEKLDNGSAAVKMWERGFESTVHPALMLRVCEAFLAEDLPDKAVEYAQQCARQNPARPHIEFALAELYLRLEMVREAQQVFEQLNTRYPDWAVNCKMLADLYRKTGEFRKAATLYSGILKQMQSVLPWACSECSATFEVYQGRCSECLEWNTVDINHQAGSMELDAKTPAIRY